MKIVVGITLVMAGGFSTDAASAFQDQASKDNAPSQRKSRWITCVVREDGAISGVGRSEESWSPRLTACVIEDIQSNKAEYRVDLGLLQGRNDLFGRIALLLHRELPP